MHRSAERPRGGVSPAFLLLLLFFFSFFFSLNDGFPWSGENLVSPLKIDGRERYPLPVRSTSDVDSPRRSRSLYPPSIYPSFCIADKVLATLGEGTFGKVVKVKDLQM